jgi:hypothetical protein
MLQSTLAAAAAAAAAPDIFSYAKQTQHCGMSVCCILLVWLAWVGSNRV